MISFKPQVTLRFLLCNLLILVIMTGLLHGQDNYKMPIKLDKFKSTIYGEKGKLKGYIINVDEKHIHYVDKKSEIDKALISSCLDCKSVSLSKVIKISKEKGSKFLATSLLSIAVGFGLTSIAGQAVLA